MIELDVNGQPQTIDPGTIEELEHAIAGPVPSDHGVCRLIVDGKEIPEAELARCDLRQVRHVRVESAPLRDIARDAVAETRDWMKRICGVMDSVAHDYRIGQEMDANARLVHIVDALQVLVHLLHGLQSHLPVNSEHHPEFAPHWESAQGDLRDAIDALAEELVQGDPVVLADRIGYALPRCLGRFEKLLEGIEA